MPKPWDRRTSTEIMAEIDKTASELARLKRQLKQATKKKAMEELNSLLLSAVKAGKKKEIMEILEQFNALGNDVMILKSKGSIMPVSEKLPVLNPVQKENATEELIESQAQCSNLRESIFPYSGTLVLLWNKTKSVLSGVANG